MATIQVTPIPYTLIDGRLVISLDPPNQLVLELSRYLLIAGAMPGSGESPRVIGKLPVEHAEIVRKRHSTHPPTADFKIQPLTKEDYAYAREVYLTVHEARPPVPQVQPVTHTKCCSADVDSSDEDEDGVDGESEDDDVEAVTELNLAQAAVKQIFDEAVSKLFSSEPTYSPREYVDTILDNLRRRYNNGEF